ncbi:MAG: hypothetical protein DMD49_13705, partial [Gemmatimonadetes bacterium]
MRDGSGPAGRADRGLRRAARGGDSGRALRLERDRAAPGGARARQHPGVQCRHRGSDGAGRVACRERQRAGRAARRADAGGAHRRHRPGPHHRPSRRGIGSGSRARFRRGDEEPSADHHRRAAGGRRPAGAGAHRTLNGVFGINDDSALGALAVLEAAGRKDVVVVGFDGTPEAEAAIARGSALKADVVQHPRTIGKTVIEIIARHLH